MKVKIDKSGKIVIAGFSSLQAYKIAIKMEKDGIKFYSGLEKKTKDVKVRREIKFLIGQEQEHLKIFQDLFDKEKEEASDTFEEDDIADYLDSNVFEPQALGKSAYEEAMNRERRSIVFYEGCVFNTEDKKAKKEFQGIIAEEKKHLLKFAELVRLKCIKTKKNCIL